MRLWTVQPLSDYQSWQEKGIYRTNPVRVITDFHRSYDWLISQMQWRLPPAPASCTSPVWAWFQAHNEAKPRPDLRYGARLPKGIRGVLLTVKVDENEVLLSDFDLWHYVLNDWYLPDTYSEEDYKTTRLEREKSWERIFDLDFAPTDIARPRAEKQIQATFWELHNKQIQDVQEFTAR